MALKACRECGKQVATSAKRCPNCGVSKPVKPPAVAQGIAAAFFLLSLGFCVLVVATPSSEQTDSGQASTDRAESAESSGIPRRDASVRFTGTQVQVTNTSSVAWTNCEVELNPKGIIRSGWSQSGFSIAPAETAEGGVLAFTKSGGERFNPATHQVETIGVDCDTPKGHAYWSGDVR